jgi:hypothetical protein
MNWDAVAALGELISAVVVVISLVYLAMQVRQANTLARGQTHQRMVEEAQQEVYKGFVDEPDIFQSLYKPEPLTEHEWIRLSGWLLAAMRQREFEWFQKQGGNIDEKLWDAYRKVIILHLGTPRTRKWWETNGGKPFDAEFCAMVKELLDINPETTYFEDFQRLVSDADPGLVRSTAGIRSNSDA